MKNSPFWKTLGALAAIALGLVWLSAALLKSADPPAFMQEISGYGILPAAWSPFQAYGFIVVEILLGVLLLFGLVPRVAGGLSVVLLLVFTGATTYAFVQGNITSCGCFGQSMARNPVLFYVEEAAFIGLGLLVFFFAPRDRSRSAPRWILSSILAAALLFAPWVAPDLPIDAWTTPIKPGADLSNLAVDGLREPLDEGQVFLAMLGPDCDPCTTSMETLDQLATTEGAPDVIGVFAGGKREKRAFILEHVPSYQMGDTPETVLRQYYRRLPVFVLLQDGIVQRAWWRAAPPVDEVMREADRGRG